MKILLSIIMVGISFSAFARLWETEEECNNRYGNPTKIEHLVYDGKKIRRQDDILPKRRY